MSARQERPAPRMTDAEYEQAVVAQQLREQQQYAQVLARKSAGEAVSQEAADEGEVQDAVATTDSEQAPSVGPSARQVEPTDMPHDQPSAARQDPIELVRCSGTA